MPVNNKRKTAPSEGATAPSKILVRRRRSNRSAPMLTADVVPAGEYRSKIISITGSFCSDGTPAVDVIYCFADGSGRSAEAKIRYPLSGVHLERLFDALLDAGLPEGAPLTDAVGIVEEVVVAYPYDGALGKIKMRRPAASPTSSAAPKKMSSKITRTVSIEEADKDDDDSEFEDFLEDDDL